MRPRPIAALSCVIGQGGTFLRHPTAHRPSHRPPPLAPHRPSHPPAPALRTPPLVATSLGPPSQLKPLPPAVSPAAYHPQLKLLVFTDDIHFERSRYILTQHAALRAAHGFRCHEQRTFVAFAEACGSAFHRTLRATPGPSNVHELYTAMLPQYREVEEGLARKA